MVRHRFTPKETVKAAPDMNESLQEPFSSSEWQRVLLPSFVSPGEAIPWLPRSRSMPKPKVQPTP
jgi:hypothetical protein